jgi:hypothetical protein
LKDLVRKTELLNKEDAAIAVVESLKPSKILNERDGKQYNMDS